MSTRGETVKALDKAIGAMNGPIFRSQVIKAQVSTMEYYVDKLLPSNFEQGNTRRNSYLPNTVTYEKRKRKKFGRLPQLVVSGKLKRRASRGKAVIRNNRVHVKFSVPMYGNYQIKGGRNWIKPTKRQMKELKSYFKAKIAVMRARNLKRQ